ncbi:MAG: phosphoribosylpyrophosphate synthetase [Nitrospinae bacterium RIFCSPLOWO2_02_FULL_39_110]|nr:MAG: phosphoribosylpyrophosphate synthetase [Nitrospinae bacterium RIFCSPHIGHO2_02_39_11]OGV98740.1 MAG: phosphoribosylpyrophosphate synthetase [Nitrospinae bacterium RIFCSPHIGHO2_12_FULL_39_42]OGW00169.1 MAG: phosphoribosylpyrophosphate synthetase [Nitrospinae bacterium RIFCSPHIGHO2_02_FULL_39_82]OGW04337.1 MAG: phosphoribosylpyrophosphate synthetase [Nitrospinae bacterium RIFCSPLOWO2_02_FULL_39_110]OGW07125.1 MAG: phosphoribosylpyrophosphate synthetase [Nitrospinae bacterium RIFCSPLOWO2_02
MPYKELLLFSGRANIPLVEEICKYLRIPLGKSNIYDFPDGEIGIKITENVRGRDVFVVQPTCEPVNKNLMELLIMIDALKRSSAERITAVIPYYGYARQDRKAEPRVPITSKLVADLVTAAGTNRVLAIDLHAGQIQGFFNLPVDHLYAAPIQIEYIKRKRLKDLVIVSPDAGGVERARAFAKKLNTSLAIIDKRRDKPGVAKVMNIIGDIKGKRAMIVDDMIDTAGTLIEATNALLKNGVREVYACCTHPVLSEPAVERINKSPLKEVIVSNTIPLSDKQKRCNKIIILSISKLLGEAIKRIHTATSVSSLFA